MLLHQVGELIRCYFRMACAGKTGKDGPNKGARATRRCTKKKLGGCIVSIRSVICWCALKDNGACLQSAQRGSYWGDETDKPAGSIRSSPCFISYDFQSYFLRTVLRHLRSESENPIYRSRVVVERS
jgi:hypothetical protein